VVQKDIKTENCHFEKNNKCKYKETKYRYQKFKNERGYIRRRDGENRVQQDL